MHISLASPSLAGTPLPSQRLTVTLDLEHHRLTGDAAITLPPNQPCTLFLGGIEPLSITLDNTPLAVAPRVELPAAPQNRHIAVRFSKQCNGEEANDCRIAPNGVSLTGDWHPRLDRDSLHELTAIIPINFEAISEAEEIETTKTATTKEVRFHFPHALAGISLVAGPYVVERQPFGNGQNVYSYFFAEDRELAADYRKRTLAYLARYAELLGPYPYRRFSIVENRLPTGYAMPGFTLLGQAVARLPFITATSLGHEVLHSWFGNGVLVDDASGNWCEGLVTYLADQAFASERGEGTEFRKQQLIEYQSYVGRDNAPRLRDFTGATGQPGLANQEGREQRAVGYAKASMVFHMLRQRIGETAFVAGLRSLYANHRFQRTGWNELTRAFETASDQALIGFFSQWLERADLPRLSAEKITVQEEAGQPVLDFVLRQEQEQSHDLRVTVAITAAGKTTRQQVALTTKDTPVRIPLDERPEQLTIDPDYDLMRELDPDETPPVWSRFAGSRDRLAILPEPDEAAALTPLVALLTSMDCPMKPASEVTSQELASHDLLFLGTRSPLLRSLLAPSQPGPGFSLEAHDNPLAPDRVTVVISSTSLEQSRAAVGKLAHYGRYTTLRFDSGRLTEKSTRQTDQGLIWRIEPPPMGIALPQALSFAAITQQLEPAQVVYIGETHTRYEDHLLQLRVIRAMLGVGKPLALGMEMFSRAAQPALDQYVAGSIDETEFLKQSRYFSRWGYDFRLYRDILRYARRHRIPVIGLNQDKEITSTVFRQGLAGLSPEQRGQLPLDRDLGLPGYRRRIVDVFTMHGAHGGKPEQENDFLQAQVIWDETMAESVADYLAGHPERRMAVLAGNGHTDRQTGIPPRVSRRLPGLRQVVLQNSDTEGIPSDSADYVLFCPPAQLPAAPVLGVLLKDHEDGVEVIGFSEQSKALEAGMREGDVIVAADSLPVKGIDDLKIILLDAVTEHPMEVQIKRQGGLFGNGQEILSISIPLTTREATPGSSPHSRP